MFDAIFITFVGITLLWILSDAIEESQQEYQNTHYRAVCDDGFKTEWKPRNFSYMDDGNIYYYVDGLLNSYTPNPSEHCKFEKRIVKDNNE